MNVSVTQLIDLGLLHEGSARDLKSSEFAVSTQDHILTGVVKPTEPQVTRFMAASGGAFETLLISTFCQTWGLDLEVDMRLISGSEFGKETGQSDRRSIDLVVRRKIDRDGTTASVPVIGIEAKFEAVPNGAWGYCPWHRSEEDRQYSNQIICYVHGCTNSLLDDSVKFIWLGLPSKTNTGPLWGNKAINDRDGAHFDLARQSQAEAEQHWAMLIWPTLREKIEQAELGDNNVTSAILRALKV